MPQTPGQNVLVLAPHPDDESVGCGGTLSLITSSGGTVDVLYLTRGENGFFPGDERPAVDHQALAIRREHEARTACHILGVRDLEFASGRDGKLHHQPELTDTILRSLRRRTYRSVFCPWPRDGHPDHAATFILFHRALRQWGGEVDVWLYEVWTPLPPNLCIAIDATIETKMRALSAHQSQTSILNYEPAFRGLARYRGLQCPPANYAEAFVNCDGTWLAANEESEAVAKFR